jgi:geranylgeranyl reductase family protein
VSHDLIILGSGPAGAAAGVTAARAGLRVALVDRAAFPRDKLCGGGFTGRSRRHLVEIFGQDTDSDLFLPCRRMRLVADGAVLGDHPDAPTIWMTLRRDFDAMLHAQAARAGCTVFAPARIAALDPQAASVALEGGPTLTAPLILGADGTNSALARALFGQAYDPAQIGFGLEVEVPRDAAAPGDAVEIDLAAAAWGYGWAFPKARSVTVGVGGLQARNPDMRAHLDRYLARHGGGAAPKCKGAFLPFGDFRTIPGQGRALLAGDAAGLVDPITGEGIAWAMKSGQLAAQAVAQALAAGAPDRALGLYTRALRPIHAELRRARTLRALIYRPRLQPAFLRLIAREPGLQRRYLALLSGDLDYADLGWRAAPKMAAKVLRRAFA